LFCTNQEKRLLLLEYTTAKKYSVNLSVFNTTKSATSIFGGLSFLI
jgi:hypothetical protein